MSEISRDEYSVWTGEEEGGKLSTNEVAKRFPSPEFPLESRANWRVPARVCGVEAAQFVRK